MLRPQFTLRSMFLSMTLLALGIGCLSPLVAWDPVEEGGGIRFVVLYVIGCLCLGIAFGVLFQSRSD